MVQMRGILRRIAVDFDVSLSQGEDGTAFDTDWKDTFTVTLPSLQVTFTERMLQS